MKEGLFCVSPAGLHAPVGFHRLGPIRSDIPEAQPAAAFLNPLAKTVSGVHALKNMAREAVGFQKSGIEQGKGVFCSVVFAFQHFK